MVKKDVVCIDNSNKTRHLRIHHGNRTWEEIGKKIPFRGLLPVIDRQSRQLLFMKSEASYDIALSVIKIIEMFSVGEVF